MSCCEARCKYRAPSMVFMMLHLLWAHGWHPGDITAWMVRHVEDAMDKAAS